jgi:hypothetical protein
MAKSKSKKAPKFRHNKKRNTAFLFESLVKELTKAVLSKDKERQSKIVKVIKEHFIAGSSLEAELKLYRALHEVNGLESNIANRLVAEVRRSHEKNVDGKKLYEEQSALIKKINKALSQDVYANFVPNYKNLATLAQMFSENTPIQERVLLEQKIVTQITTKQEEKEMVPIDNLVYKTFVEKFNEQYEGKLHEEQQGILTRYIYSISDNGVSLKTYLNEEIERLRKIIKKSLRLEEVKEDMGMVESTNKVLGVLDSFKEIQINEASLSKILKIQELAREVQN